MPSAEAIYHEIAGKLTTDQIDHIKSYYSEWEGQDKISLKFRFLKGFFLNNHRKKGEWHILQDISNKRRIPNKKLVIVINNLIDAGYTPIRLFQSVSEWLAPNEVFAKDIYTNWLINPGFIPFEEDTSLEQSIQTARGVYSNLDAGHIVYSGNKSIHVWYPIQFDDDEISHLKTPLSIIQSDRKLRHSLFKKMRQSYPSLDKRISTDTWRVVPVINSLNAITGRIVTALTSDQLKETTAMELRRNTKLSNW